MVSGQKTIGFPSAPDGPSTYGMSSVESTLLFIMTQLVNLALLKPMLLVVLQFAKQKVPAATGAWSLWTKGKPKTMLERTINTNDTTRTKLDALMEVTAELA